MESCGSAVFSGVRFTATLAISHMGNGGKMNTKTTPTYIVFVIKFVILPIRNLSCMRIESDIYSILLIGFSLFVCSIMVWICIFSGLYIHIFSMRNSKAFNVVNDVNKSIK